MKPENGGHGQVPARHRTEPNAHGQPIDRAIDTATNHLTDAQEEFVQTEAVEKAETVVQRAEDLELLAEEGHEDARQRGSEPQP